jgi:protein involved in sex pheromone biosynthesis
VYKRLDEVFTDTMIDQAKTVFTESMLKEYHGPIAELFKKEVVDPNIEEINERTKQENDPLYLAYMLEYAFKTAG